jgi:hypothetical protein
MATSFPAAIDTFTNPTSTDFLDTSTVLHDVQHANENDAIAAIQTKIGATNSTNITSLDYLSKRSHAPQAVLTPGVTVPVSLDSVAYLTLVANSDVQFTVSNLAPDNSIAKSVTILISAGASSRQVTFQSGIVLIGAVAPVTLGANKKGLLTITSYGPTVAETIASFGVQP